MDFIQHPILKKTLVIPLQRGVEHKNRKKNYSFSTLSHPVILYKRTQKAHDSKQSTISFSNKLLLTNFKCFVSEYKFSETKKPTIKFRPPVFFCKRKISNCLIKNTIWYNLFAGAGAIRDNLDYLTQKKVETNKNEEEI